MRNAKKYDANITIGSVPDRDDLDQLKSLGFKTLVDVRDETEKFGGLVEKNARGLSLNYVNIPIDRQTIRLSDVKAFYKAVYHKPNQPVYAFSRFGKKPLAFLLLFEAVAKGEPVSQVFRKASRFAFSIEGDLCLQSFIVDLMNTGASRQILAMVEELNPALLAPVTSAPGPKAAVDEEEISNALARAADYWARHHDELGLLRELNDLVTLLERAADAG